MKTANLIATLCPNVMGVCVQFKDHAGNGLGKAYTYLSDDKSIQVGDEVVVDAPSVGLTVVIVSGIEKTVELRDNINYKWVVSKIDTEAHEARLEKLQEAVDKLAELEHKAATKRKMKEMIEALGDDGAAALQEIMDSLKTK